MTDAVAWRPSLVAVMVALPALAPVTSPLLDTLATAAFDELHVIVRPVRMLFDASRNVAVNCWVPPTVRVADVGDRLTDATGAKTVTDTLRCWPSLEAVIVVVPPDRPATRPLEDTFATAGFDELHVTVRPLRVERTPFAIPVRKGVNCCEPPTARLTALGDTEIDDTGTGSTVTGTVADSSPEAADTIAASGLPPNT